MNKHIDVIAQREVTRKEFLTTLGFGLMSIMGLGTIIKLLTGKHPLSSVTSLEKRVSHGYGTSAYGR